MMRVKINNFNFSFNFNSIVVENLNKENVYFLSMSAVRIIQILSYFYYFQDDLNNFLSVAEELAVKGLTTNETSGSVIFCLNAQSSPIKFFLWYTYFDFVHQRQKLKMYFNYIGGLNTYWIWGIWALYGRLRGERGGVTCWVESQKSQ